MPTRRRHLVAGALLVVASLAPSAAGRYADSATSGVIFGFDPDAAGKIVWEQRVAVGSSSGGVFWGSATDGVNIYAANADFVGGNPAASGGMHAVALRTGRLIWSAPGAGCGTRVPCKPSQAAAVTLIPGGILPGNVLLAFSPE